MKAWLEGLLNRFLAARLVQRALGSSPEGFQRLMLKAAVGSFGVTIGGTALASAVQLLLARLLGVEAFGVYTYVLSIVTLLFLLSRLGIDAALVRFIAEYRELEDWASLRGILRWSDGWVAATGVAVGAVVALGGWLLSGRMAPEMVQTLVAGALLLPAMALLGLRQRAIQGLMRPALGQIPDQVARPLLTAAFAGAMALLPGVTLGAPQGMWASAFAAILAVVLGTIFLRRQLPLEAKRVRPRYHRQDWLRVSLPLLLVAGMWRVLQQTDILVVGSLLGTTAAGIYGVASRLARLVVLGLVAVNSITAPMVSRVHARQELASLQRLVSFSAWCSLAVCLPGIVLLIVFRGPILGLFGEDFVTAGAVLVILCAGRLVSAVTGPVGWLLNMTDHQGVSARIQTTVTVLNLCLNLPAVLWLGIEGAAAATAFAFILQNLWTWWEVKKRLGIDGSVASSFIGFLGRGKG